ncbi:MAG: DEAD/DEAH box helicase [Chloroflexi bacterium]|nr:DEAD/DEAH box helicase [Chloroflexota bacterium]
MNFDSFSFHPLIKAGISSVGYSIPTSIQLRTIPAILEGRDVLGLAQTGTGKTAAFVLPILQRLMRGPRGKLRALILSPTRELAEQTHTAITALGRQTRLRSLTLYGGVSAQPQIKGLRSGADIAVACPGRLLDLMGQKVIDLSSIEVLVLDEADQMFDMGFLPDIRRILAALPSARQTLLFSATMPAEIRSLADSFLDHPVTVEIGIARPVETVSHAVYPVDQTRKTEMLAALLRQAGSGQILVFTRTKHRAKKLAESLAKNGFAATSLQGNLSQNQRQKALDGFRSGRVRVLVATDIAARGIDVSHLSHVINYDMPDTAEAYTHRIGRTGRMTQLGTALSLVTSEDRSMVRTIERLLGYSLESRQVPGFEARGNGPEQPGSPRASTANLAVVNGNLRRPSSHRRRAFSASAGGHAKRLSEN